MSVTVIVGLIGSGKTTLAKRLSPRRHFGFDHDWHATLMARGCKPHDLVNYYAIRVKRRSSDVVIDGWWTWYVQWWTAENDNTLFRLQDKIDQKIRLVHLLLSPEEAYAEYLKKYKTGHYGTIRGHPLSDPKAYKKSIPLRQSYLLEKVNEWATSSGTCSTQPYIPINPDSTPASEASKSPSPCTCTSGTSGSNGPRLSTRT